MRFKTSAILAAAVLCLGSTASLAALTSYSEDFEGLVQADPNALADAGWLVFGNVFNADSSYAYGYGPFPAPNGGAAFSAVDAGQGGPDQGAQQLSVYSDYNNADHGNNRSIEANVFQEQTVSTGDIGGLWRFRFDAKRGNIEGQTTALAFIKTLDPNNGFALTNFITKDMTNAPAAWESHYLEIFLDNSLDGQILQIGFLSVATMFQGSGIFYDNITFLQETPLHVSMDSMSATATQDGVRINWVTASEVDTIGFRVLREAADARRKTLVGISSMIQAAGTSFEGAAYEFVDSTKPAGQARVYWVEDIDAFGRTTLHGPIEVQRPNRVRNGRIADR